MKVCMIVHNPPNQGGIVQYCILLVNELNKIANIKLNHIGFKKLWPSIFYPGNEPDPNSNAIDFAVPSKNIITWYNPLSWVKTWFIARKSDIIHFHWYNPIFAPIYYVILKLNKLFSKKKIFVTCHNIEPHEDSFLDGLLIKSIFSKVDHFIVHANENKERLKNKYGINPKRATVIDHGTFGYFTKWSKKRKKELRQYFRIDKKTKNIILFFGYIRNYKGLEYLIKAMPYVLKQEPNTKVIVGGALWGNWDKKYGKYIKKYKLHKHFIIHPYYIHDKEVHKYFDVADIVVLPYFNTEQTISGPLLVSFAFRKPAVVSACGGIKNLVDNGKNAILTEPGNEKLLADNIIKILRNKKLQSTLGKNAFKSIEKHTWDKVANRYYNLYRIITKNKEINTKI